MGVKESLAEILFNNRQIQSDTTDEMKFVALSLLISISLLASASLSNRWLSRADAPTVKEIAASPLSDPDPHDETSIAISPKNDQVIVGASKVIQGGATLDTGRGNTRVEYYFSSDGGSTWGSGIIGLETPQKTWGRETDPSVAADLDGNFYICVLALDNSSFDTGVYVYKSTDSGRTFGSPSPVVFDIGSANPRRADKCYMAIDASASSAFKNSIYAVWTSSGNEDNGQGLTVIRMAHKRATDSTFSASKVISHAGDMRGPSLAIGPNGEFYAAWVGMPARVLLFNASFDGGDNLLPGLASIDLNIHNYVGSLEGPNATFSLSGLDRSNSFPTIDVDRSTGPNRGMVYVAWAETTNGFDTDIFLSRLTPHPGSLPDVSSPVKVNNDASGTDQFFPWLGVDSSNGAVEVAFADRRVDPGTVLMNTFLARSTDGGQNFKENTRVSSASSDPRVQADIAGMNSIAIGMGDYLGLVAANGKTHVLWTDTRHGKQEIFYGKVDFSSSPVPPPPGFSGDNCSSPRVIGSLPFTDTIDTSLATSSADDPVSCTGNRDSSTIWYSLIAAANTVYGVDTSLSNYDTVASVYTGACGALTLVACNDDFGNNSGNRALLTFSAKAGVAYLIEVSGKSSSGLLKLHVGYPTITNVQFTSAPNGSDSLQIEGAGFINGNLAVSAQQNGSDIGLTGVLFNSPPFADGTQSTLFATRKKLRKIVRRGSLLVRVESPAGSGNFSNSFLFTQ